MTLRARILLGLAVAGAAVVVLQVLVGGSDAGARSAPAPGAQPVEAGERSEVLGQLSGRAWLIYLTRSDAAVPPLAAPVLEIEPGGRVRLLRPPPLAEGPEAGTWLAAGVVLPAARLAKLSPAERVSVLDALAALSGGRALSADQLVPLGVGASRVERERLVRWRR